MFEETMKREELVVESSCMKRNLLTETLAGKIMALVFRKTVFDVFEKSYQYSVFDYFGQPRFHFLELLVLFSNSVTFYE